MPSTHFLSAQLLVSVVTIVLVIHVILILCAYSIYLERKISASIQDRIGPNRVGFDFGLPGLAFLKGCLGLGQPLADGIKFLLKEDYKPKGADRYLFTLAPMAIIIPALIGFAVIPWGGTWTCPDIPLAWFGVTIPGGPVSIAGAPVNIGIVYILATASLGIYGVTLGGWASNNKYSFLGGLRASAQMISYEIPMGLSLLAVLLLTGSLLPGSIIAYQLQHGWLIFTQPVAAVTFFTCILAEANRAPFDNAECEQELVGGYHTEYSSMRFALFFLAEYVHMITASAFFALLFLGGWDLIPGVQVIPDGAAGIVGFLFVLAKFAVFLGKVVTLVCFMMVVRWTLPRLRFDQVMQVGWQAAIPLSLAVVIMTAVMVHLGWTGLVPMLIANAGLVAVVLAILPLLPRATVNRRILLAGSRFSPAPGERVVTRPTDPTALDDRPVTGTGAVISAR